MSVTLSPPLFLEFMNPNNSGSPAAGFKLFTYAAGTSTKQNTWTDSTQTVANSNPIVLDANGIAANSSSSSIWGDPSIGYKFVLAPANDTDPPTSPIRSIDNVYFPLTVLSGIDTFPRTPLEISLGVNPVNLGYQPGELYRYGTNTSPGTTDMTAAANTWLSLGGVLTMSVPDLVLVSGTLILKSGTTLTINKGATFKTNTPGVSFFKALGQSNISFTGGTLQQTANSSAVHIGIVELNGCSNCKVESVEIIGSQWGGILLSGSSNCTVRGNYIHNSLGVTTDNVDSHDISCYGASSFNVIDGNVCYGGTNVEHGIMIQDPGSSLFPLKNTVYGNRVGPHKSYGILNYLIDHANTYCTIENNEIEGITGTSQSGNSGAGIYNQGAGGTLIANNTIRNCCVSTLTASLTPAGIGLNLDASFEPVSVVGNNIFDMANFYGIEVVNGPANIVGNTVKFSTGVLANIGIYANVASNVNISGNHVTIDGGIAGGTGIFAFANGANISNVSICGNYVLGTSAAGVRVDTTGAPTSTNVVVNDNNISGGASTSVPVLLGNVINGTVSGNLGNANTTYALSANACTQMRYTGNVLLTSGATSVLISGTSTGSYFDKSNNFNGQRQNTGTGCIIEQLGSAIPATGNNSAVGDRVEQSVPVVGNPKGWRCTVAGNAGTWVSEGNL